VSIDPESEPWIRSKADEAAYDAGCRFRNARANHVRTFFRKFLRHSKGQWAGKPFELLDWQWDRVVAPLFGWQRENGTRRYRKGYVEIPKKNGKSALGSGLSLYMLVGDNEPGAEVYNAAADRDQAGIAYGEAANMVEASPALASRLEVIRSKKQISHRLQKAWYRALSADVPTKEGLNIHFLLFDELHAQKTRDL
jgi:phage terminase large subunit-like protein